MKARVLRVTAMLAVVVAFTAVSAYGQGRTKRQTFVVPFEFSVGERLLPAGEYTFISEAQIIRIQSKDGKQNVAVLPVSTHLATQSRAESKLKFKRYGVQYYLSQVWLPDGIGRELKRKRTESNLAQNVSTIEVSGGNR